MKLSAQRDSLFPLRRPSRHINNPKLFACDRERARLNYPQKTLADLSFELSRSIYRISRKNSRGEGGGGPARCFGRLQISRGKKKNEKRKEKQNFLANPRIRRELREEASLSHRVPSLPLLTPLRGLSLDRYRHTRAYTCTYARTS